MCTRDWRILELCETHTQVLIGGFRGCRAPCVRRALCVPCTVRAVHCVCRALCVLCTVCAVHCACRALCVPCTAGGEEPFSSCLHKHTQGDAHWLVIIIDQVGSDQECDHWTEHASRTNSESSGEPSWWNIFWNYSASYKVDHLKIMW